MQNKIICYFLVLVLASISFAETDLVPIFYNVQSFYLAAHTKNVIRHYSSNVDYEELSLDSLVNPAYISSYSIATVVDDPSYLVVQLKDPPIAIYKSKEFMMEFFVSTANSMYKEVMASVQSAVAGKNKVQILYPEPNDENVKAVFLAGYLGSDILNLCSAQITFRGNIMFCPIRRLTILSE